MGQEQQAKNGGAATKVLLTILILSIAALAFLLWHERVEFYKKMTPELKDSELFEDMQSGMSICFVGDSITAGTETRGIPWYSPIERYIKGDVSNFSYSGWTTNDVIYWENDIPAADIYIFAIGINDVLFFNERPAANTTEEYTDNLDTIVASIRESSPDAKMYFIAPWPFVNYPNEMVARREDYSDALRSWCADNGYIFIEPAPIILPVIEGEDGADYLADSIHPNRVRGLGLYSYAVLYTEHQRRADGQTA